jgi:hypothetical protein
MCFEKITESKRMLTAKISNEDNLIQRASNKIHKTNRMNFPNESSCL